MQVTAILAAMLPYSKYSVAHWCHNWRALHLCADYTEVRWPPAAAGYWLDTPALAIHPLLSGVRLHSAEENSEPAVAKQRRLFLLWPWWNMQLASQNLVKTLWPSWYINIRSSDMMKGQSGLEKWEILKYRLFSHFSHFWLSQGNQKAVEAHLRDSGPSRW